MKHPQSTPWLLPSQVLNNQVNSQILSWLSDQGSLTKRLKAYCPDQFSVEVLAEEWVRPDPSEARLLNVPITQRVLLRQVHLKCGNNLCVYARSVIPLSTLQGKHRRLQFLGNKPLGEYLFASPNLQRSRVEWSKLTAQSSLYKVAMPQNDKKEETLWGRRSLFTIDKKSLLVSEFFLPVLFGEHNN